MHSEPCRCVAYAYPHRPKSGKCEDPGPMPECCDCAYGREVKDPFGTGDRWYTEIECGAPRQVCPWGKE